MNPAVILILTGLLFVQKAETPSMKELISLMSSEHPKEREEAVEKIFKNSKVWIEGDLMLLKDSRMSADPEVARRAEVAYQIVVVELFKAKGRVEDFDLIINVISNKDSAEKFKIISKTKELVSQKKLSGASGLLKILLKDDDAEVRAYTLFTVEKLRIKDLAKDVFFLIKDESNCKTYTESGGHLCCLKSTVSQFAAKTIVELSAGEFIK